MEKEKVLSIAPLLEGGKEAKGYNKVTKKILEEEAKKLSGTPKQADNWNALANQVVGANPM